MSCVVGEPLRKRVVNHQSAAARGGGGLARRIPASLTEMESFDVRRTRRARGSVIWVGFVTFHCSCRAIRAGTKITRAAAKHETARPND